MTTSNQFNQLAKKYRAADETHYVKKYSLIPVALKLLGDVKDREILDVGCGYGLISRMLAERGARVTGIDGSLEMIKLAREQEKQNPRGINYHWIPAENIPNLDLPFFDDALAMLVMNYMGTQKDISKVFKSIYSCLKPNSRFISFQNHLVEQGFNGGRANIDRVYERITSLPESNDIPRFKFTRTVGDQQFSADINDWPRRSYEEAAKEAGFKELKWITCRNVIAAEGMLSLPLEYWENYRNTNLFLGFETRK